MELSHDRTILSMNNIDSIARALRNTKGTELQLF